MLSGLRSLPDTEQMEKKQMDDPVYKLTPENLLKLFIEEELLRIVKRKGDEIDNELMYGKGRIYRIEDPYKKFGVPYTNEQNKKCNSEDIQDDFI